MPRLVQKSGYIRAGQASGYMTYIATRDGVEVLPGAGPVTTGQAQLISKLLADFPDTTDLFEYEDYLATPNRETASAFISMALDLNLQNITPKSTYMKYIAQRPRVEKRSKHGLFSCQQSVDLESALLEIEQHTGNVWTIIYSLRREDAARLSFDKADAWRTLLMKHQHELATAMKIPMKNFRWYAAFHNEGHHPHIHLMIWSNDPKKGFLTKDGITLMRSKLTNTIFQDELQRVYVSKDIAYKELTAAARDAMRRLILQMEHQLCDSPVIEQFVLQLAEELNSAKGRKQYGYLKKPLKNIVDQIVDEVAKQPEVAACYEKWNEIRDTLNAYYCEGETRKYLPLSQQNEFRSIKNMVIQEANRVRLGTPSFEDESMCDEPEPQEPLNTFDTINDQAARYRAAKSLLHNQNVSQGKQEAAAAELEKLWDEGFSLASYQLGKVYRDDKQHLYDLRKAELWFRRSAEAGNDCSAYALGKLLLGQEQTESALCWLTRAAMQGNQFAQYHLGKLYLTGDGVVKKDVQKALDHLTSSAMQGNQYAQYTLGKLYLSDLGVSKDRDKAKAYLSQSAAQGNRYAQFLLDRFDQHRDPSVLLSTTRLLHHIAGIFRTNSVPPRNPTGIRIDSKRRKKLLRKRLALGHKIDDHENQAQYQQTM